MVDARRRATLSDLHRVVDLEDVVELDRVLVP
jgi:hypothetical protein